jgi:hypothetical protein
MNAREWLACEDPAAMLEFLRGKASDRKARLFACACCRRMWDRFDDLRSGRAVGVAERHADGAASDEELKAAAAAAGDADRAGMDAASAAVPVASPGAFDAARMYADAGETLYDAFLDAVYRQPDASRGDYLAGDPFTEGAPGRVAMARKEAERGVLIVLLRDVFGNPFRPVTPAASWLTPTVLSLARDIYNGRAFEDLPTLADGLEDAGCTDRDILEHCRSGGEHVLGCWVVDLLLGKE